MTELDEMWAQAIAEAKLKAQALGRGDVADYLALKEANDAARNVGLEWLKDSFLEFAGELNRRGAGLSVEHSDTHRFSVGAATMVGLRLRFNLGVRNLTIEAGFPRTPQDGFVRGGGLACGRITHFGMPKANAELLLIKTNQKAPQWLVINQDNSRSPFAHIDLQRHFAMFLEII
jgi:hypothetical protein